MSNWIRWITAVVVVAVVSLVVGISFGRYLETNDIEPEGAGFFNTPAFDSGWMNISIGKRITLEHGLGSTEVLVYIVGKNSEGMIHQRRYGGDTGNGLQGIYWSNLTESTINVLRLRDDYHPDRIYTWNQIRVMIWRIREPTI